MLLIFFLLFPLISFASTNLTIVYNPSGATPLSALYKKNQTNVEPIIIFVQGKTSEESIGVRYPANFGTEFPIHGLYPAHNNTIVIREGSSPPQRFSLKTPPIVIKAKKKDYAPIDYKITVLSNTLPPAKPFQQELFFTSLPNNHEILGIDRFGSIRYLFQSTNQNPWLIRMERDKTDVYFITINNHNYYQKIDLLGKTIFRKKLKVHHELIPYKNGEEFILAHSKWGWEDQVAILNKNKDIIETINLGDVLYKATAPEDYPLLKQLVYDSNNIYVNPTNNKKMRIDWAHGNSLLYIPEQNELLVSTRHLGILALEVGTWDLKWFFADPRMKIPSGLKYAQRPETDLYLADVPSLQKYQMSIDNINDSPQGQHALLLQKNGDVLLFDNQVNLPQNQKRHSRVMEYAFDRENKKAHLTMIYEDPDFLHSQYVGDVDVIPYPDGDHTLIFYAHAKPRRIIELNANNEIVFMMDLTMYTMAYKIDKFPLYPFPDLPIPRDF